jgi:hypothetical protein
MADHLRAMVLRPSPLPLFPSATQPSVTARRTTRRGEDRGAREVSGERSGGTGRSRGAWGQDIVV